MSDVDKNVQVGPFSKAPAQVMVHGIMMSDRKKCLIIFVPKCKLVTANSFQGALPPICFAMTLCYIS